MSSPREYIQSKRSKVEILRNAELEAGEIRLSLQKRASQDNIAEVEGKPENNEIEAKEEKIV